MLKKQCIPREFEVEFDSTVFVLISLSGSPFPPNLKLDLFLFFPGDLFDFADTSSTSPKSAAKTYGSGGVVWEDLVVGTGPEAKIGKMVRKIRTTVQSCF